MSIEHTSFDDPLEAKAFIIAHADRERHKFHAHARQTIDPTKYHRPHDPGFSTFIRAADASALCDAIDNAIKSKATHEAYEFVTDTWSFTFRVGISDSSVYLSINFSLDDKEEEE